MSNLMNPCVELCYNRYGKQYSEECDEICAYAKAVKELKESKKVGHWRVTPMSRTLWCTACNKLMPDCIQPTPYCPFCGAEMIPEGEKSNDSDQIRSF